MGDVGQEEETVRRGFRLTGRVQGVGFRWWTRKTAQRLGIEGTVRNRSDGSVEIHARGPGEAMDTFAKEIRSGPSSAAVRDLEEMKSEGELPDEFRIVR